MIELESLDAHECVLCETDGEITELLHLLNSKGFEWCNGSSYLDSIGRFKAPHTFFVKNRTQMKFEYAKELKYNIISFSKIVKTTKIKDLFNI